MLLIRALMIYIPRPVHISLKKISITKILSSLSRSANFTEDIVQQQQQQNFSPKLRCLFLAIMKFIEHAVSQAKKLNQLMHIAS